MGVGVLVEPGASRGSDGFGGRSHVPLFVIVALVGGMLVAGSVVYAWQSHRLSAVEAVSAQATSDLAAERKTTATLNEAISSLRAERSTLEAHASALQARIERLSGRQGELARRVDDLSATVAEGERSLEHAQARLETVRAQLAAAHERALVAAGPGLADGRYVGTIEGVGASSSPARVAVRVTGRARGGALAHAGWRVFAVDPAAAVHLTTWRDGRDVTLTLAQFEHVFDGRARWNAAMRGVRYWVQIEGGKIVSLGDVA